MSEKYSDQLIDHTVDLFIRQNTDTCIHCGAKFPKNTSHSCYVKLNEWHIKHQQFLIDLQSKNLDFAQFGNVHNQWLLNNPKPVACDGSCGSCASCIVPK